MGIERIGRVAQAHIRLTILRLLAEQPRYAANTSLLTDGLEELGLPASRDQVETEAAWLAEQGLVVREAHGPVTRLVLARRGREAAAGTIEVPGVKRPTPDED